jgi:hypothetical protein
MINLKKGNTDTILVTSKEMTTLAITIFKFIFTNRITQDEVSVWLTNTSTTDRYQKFSIVTSTYFANENEGLWSYEVYGSASIGGVPTTPILETGYMNLNPSTEFAPTSYSEQSNQFKTYNG